jgi:hypothetical protein
MDWMDGIDEQRRERYEAIKQNDFTKEELEHKLADSQENLSFFENMLDEHMDLAVKQEAFIDVLCDLAKKLGSESKEQNEVVIQMSEAFSDAAKKFIAAKAIWNERYQKAQQIAQTCFARTGGISRAKPYAKMKEEAQRLARAKVPESGSWPSMSNAAKSIKSEVDRYAQTMHYTQLTVDQADKTICKWLGEMPEKTTLFASKHTTSTS